MPERSSESNEEITSSRPRRRLAAIIALVAAVVIVAAILGVLAGRLFSQRQTVNDEARRVDEYLGLAPRTGLTGELELQVAPLGLAIKAGRPAKLELTLTNRSRKRMFLNNWFTPVPSFFDTNQFPFKVKMYVSGRPARYKGGVILLPQHTRKDFFALRPGKSKTIDMDISRGPGRDAWDMSAPGVYTAEIWYQTYLTGRYIGVRAWTGMTNHVVVPITVTK